MKNTKTLDMQIAKIKAEILAVELMRPGSLKRQTRKAKGTYGEYWHLSFTFQGKGRTQYIRDEYSKTIEQEIKAYRQFRALVDKLVEKSIERSNLAMANFLNEQKK